MAILTRKLKNLPPATSLSDTDIIVGENEIETQKITLYQIVNFICSHNIIQNAFAAKSLFEEHVADMIMHITSSERTSWNDAYNKRHEHSNKAIIDKLSQTMLDSWNDADSKKHTHSNKSILDSITQALVNNWNDANTKKHTHSNKTVLDGITAEKIEEWDSSTGTGGDGHTHNNKPVLDSITQAKITAWDNAVSHVEIISSSEPSQQIVNGHWLQPY